jgi:rRNA-processing protein FCF1
MILASEKIKNISNIGTEIGTIEFLVPNMVIDELETLSQSKDNKKKDLLIMH